MPYTNLNTANLPYDEERFLTHTVAQRRRFGITDEVVRNHELAREFKAQIKHWMDENNCAGELDEHLECCQMLMEDWNNSIHYKNHSEQYKWTLKLHLTEAMDMEDSDHMSQYPVWDDCKNFLKNL